MQENRAIRVLPASSEVAEKIEAIYPELSDALRIFADFVLGSPMKVVQLSINDTVHASGVSVATANRFARRLGYDGYPQFRAEVVRAFEHVLAPVDRLRQQISEGSSIAERVSASFNEDIENMRDTLANLDMARVETLAREIVARDHVYALGFDNSAALSSIFAHRLAVAGVHVQTNPTGGGRLTAAREIARLPEGSIVMAIAFPRYIRDTVELAEVATLRGLTVVGITDTQSSPLAQVASWSIYLQARRTLGSTSDCAILAFLEALSVAIAALRPGADRASEEFADLGLPFIMGKVRD
ncbi:MurR/RpiR family transcriptional regulator [Pseudooceanicola algae]|uniref:HTH-type transcriptional regulator MurR n=1 Tax=Pseudooceanicola algae TaxID=1537215 RepID=A0A418SFU8_9RHOB|nr:MurR/RpiR family transcriptional regulator [Pseudooceanicola algae]QPM91533.1 HTH-type transcriptional regulator MurR [Pseudooceanicola algae]